MVVFRKAKTIITKELTAYGIADSSIFHDTLVKAGATEEQVKRMRLALQQNAFSLCIHGAQLRLGNGYIVECE